MERTMETLFFWGGVRGGVVFRLGLLWVEGIHFLGTGLVNGKESGVEATMV